MLKPALLAVALLLSPVASQAQTHSHSHSAPAVTSADRVLGRADAPVTVIEYASFVCSHCADWHTTVFPAFKARFIDTGQVRLVFRDFPTNPVDVGVRAAAIGRCAAPERFFDVASSFMIGQAALIRGAPTRPWYDAAIAVSGRTPAQIDACVEDPATLAGIRAEVGAASAAGVQGTPTFFVNGRMIENGSLAGLTAAIQSHLAGR